MKITVSEGQKTRKHAKITNPDPRQLPELWSSGSSDFGDSGQNFCASGQDFGDSGEDFGDPMRQYDLTHRASTT